MSAEISRQAYSIRSDEAILKAEEAVVFGPPNTDPEVAELVVPQNTHLSSILPELDPRRKHSMTQSFRGYGTVSLPPNFPASQTLDPPQQFTPSRQPSGIPLSGRRVSFSAASVSSVADASAAASARKGLLASTDDPMPQAPATPVAARVTAPAAGQSWHGSQQGAASARGVTLPLPADSVASGSHFSLDASPTTPPPPNRSPSYPSASAAPTARAATAPTTLTAAARSARAPSPLGGAGSGDESLPRTRSAIARGGTDQDPVSPPTAPSQTQTRRTRDVSRPAASSSASPLRRRPPRFMWQLVRVRVRTAIRQARASAPTNVDSQRVALRNILLGSGAATLRERLTALPKAAPYTPKYTPRVRSIILQAQPLPVRRNRATAGSIDDAIARYCDAASPAVGGVAGAASAADVTRRGRARSPPGGAGSGAPCSPTAVSPFAARRGSRVGTAPPSAMRGGAVAAGPAAVAGAAAPAALAVPPTRARKFSQGVEAEVPVRSLPTGAHASPRAASAGRSSVAAFALAAASATGQPSPPPIGLYDPVVAAAAASAARRAAAAAAAERRHAGAAAATAATMAVVKGGALGPHGRPAGGAGMYLNALQLADSSVYAPPLALTGTAPLGDGADPRALMAPPSMAAASDAGDGPDTLDTPRGRGRFASASASHLGGVTGPHPPSPSAHATDADSAVGGADGDAAVSAAFASGEALSPTRTVIDLYHPPSHFAADPLAAARAAAAAADAAYPGPHRETAMLVATTRTWGRRARALGLAPPVGMEWAADYDVTSSSSDSDGRDTRDIAVGAGGSTHRAPASAAVAALGGAQGRGTFTSRVVQQVADAAGIGPRGARRAAGPSAAAAKAARRALLRGTVEVGDGDVPLWELVPGTQAPGPSAGMVGGAGGAHGQYGGVYAARVGMPGGRLGDAGGTYGGHGGNSAAALYAYGDGAQLLLTEPAGRHGRRPPRGSAATAPRWDRGAARGGSQIDALAAPRPASAPGGAPADARGGHDAAHRRTAAVVKDDGMTRQGGGTTATFARDAARLLAGGRALRKAAVAASAAAVAVAAVDPAATAAADGPSAAAQHLTALLESSEVVLGFVPLPRDCARAAVRVTVLPSRDARPGDADPRGTCGMYVWAEACVAPVTYPAVTAGGAAPPRGNGGGGGGGGGASRAAAARSARAAPKRARAQARGSGSESDSGSGSESGGASGSDAGSASPSSAGTPSGVLGTSFASSAAGRVAAPAAAARGRVLHPPIDCASGGAADATFVPPASARGLPADGEGPVEPFPTHILIVCGYRAPAGAAAPRIRTPGGVAVDVTVTAAPPAAPADAQMAKWLLGAARPAASADGGDDGTAGGAWAGLKVRSAAHHRVRQIDAARRFSRQQRGGVASLWACAVSDATALAAPTPAAPDVGAPLEAPAARAAGAAGGGGDEDGDRDAAMAAAAARGDDRSGNSDSSSSSSSSSGSESESESAATGSTGRSSRRRKSRDRRHRRHKGAGTEGGRSDGTASDSGSASGSGSGSGSESSDGSSESDSSRSRSRRSKANGTTTASTTTGAATPPPGDKAAAVPPMAAAAAPPATSPSARRGQRTPKPLAPWVSDGVAVAARKAVERPTIISSHRTAAVHGGVHAKASDVPLAPARAPFVLGPVTPRGGTASPRRPATSGPAAAPAPRGQRPRTGGAGTGGGDEARARLAANATLAERRLREIALAAGAVGTVAIPHDPSARAAIARRGLRTGNPNTRELLALQALVDDSRQAGRSDLMRLLEGSSAADTSSAARIEDRESESRTSVTTAETSSASGSDDSSSDSESSRSSSSHGDNETESDGGSRATSD